MMYLNTIPDTGAIFAFGKSFLTVTEDDYDQNYFFIKRDPIRKISCGPAQSAVISESGRLFVWGENMSGQCGIGSSEITITRPTCVKDIKKMGHIVKDFKFGCEFSVLLTGSNEIFYSGKNIFLYHAKIKSLEGVFKNRTISRLPVKLNEFDDLHEKFGVIKTGDDFFLVLNRNRKVLYIWSHDLTHPSIFYRTDGDAYIKFIECGKHSTVFVTNPNDLHLSGKFGNISVSVCTKVHNPVPNVNITGLHVSENGEIYLVTENGIVFKSNKFKRTSDLKFEELKFLKHKVVKVTTGFNFLSIITDDNRCLSSLDSDKTNLIESRKLKKLDVLDIDSGSAHIIASVIPKGSKHRDRFKVDDFELMTEDAEDAENTEEVPNDNDDQIEIETFNDSDGIQGYNLSLTNSSDVQSIRSLNSSKDENENEDQEENGNEEEPGTNYVENEQESETNGDGIDPDSLNETETVNENGNGNGVTSNGHSDNSENVESDYSLKESITETKPIEPENLKPPHIEINNKPDNIGNVSRTSSNRKLKKAFKNMKTKSICGNSDSVIEENGKTPTDVHLSKACIIM